MIKCASGYGSPWDGLAPCRPSTRENRLSSLPPAHTKGNTAQPTDVRVGKDYHHNVYVILLDARAAKHRSVLRANPKRDFAKPCVYVGMSGLPPEHRFENHKHGYKAAWVVKKYGVQLMPELYAHLNPMPYEAALQMELELAEDLRNEGYTVTGGH